MTCASAAVLDVLFLQLQSALYFCEFGFMNMTLFGVRWCGPFVLLLAL